MKGFLRDALLARAVPSRAVMGSDTLFTCRPHLLTRYWPLVGRTTPHPYSFGGLTPGIRTDTQSPQNVSHHRSRSRLAHHSTNRTTHPLRSDAYAGTGLQRNAESNEAHLQCTSPAAPSGSASGARRAPNLGSVQPSRSPRPPFEESVRSTTRRTPGSEDATSVETEIGYPVVGPATSRGHTTVTNTLFHQEVIVFSQDVSTNTPQTEHYTVVNSPQNQGFSDGPPPTQESVTTPEEEDTERASSESQTDHVRGIPVLEHCIPTLSEVQSVISEEEQQQPAAHSTEHTSQENHEALPVQVPIIGTETSPFRPLPKTTEASSKLPPGSNSGSSQNGRLPTNFYFPSQMRRNRSNTSHGNGSSHRKITSIGDDRGNIDCKSNTWCCSKQSRTNLTASDYVYHDCAPVELCSSRVTGIRSSETPIEIMVHSLHCQGNCQIESRLEDKPHTPYTCNEVQSSKLLEVSRLQCWDKKYRRHSKGTQETDFETIALNVMSCISWSDLPNNLALTDCQGKAVQNVRVIIVPCNFLPTGPSLYVPNGKPSDQENSTETRLFDIRSDDLPGQIYRLVSSSKSSLAAQNGGLISYHSQLKSTIAAQASFQEASKSEKILHVVNCSTQSMLQDAPSLRIYQPGDISVSLASPLQFCEIYQDKESPHDLCTVNVDLKKAHSECISDDGSRESICDKWRLPHARRPRRNATDLNAPVELINQSCGSSYPSETTSTGIGGSKSDLYGCSCVPILAKEEHSYVGANSSIAPDHLNHFAETSCDTLHMHETLPGHKLSGNPLLVITKPEKEIKVAKVHEKSEPIDMENHLFVRKTSTVSVASSVYIGDDGIAFVTGGEKPRMSVLSVSEPRQSQEGPCAQSTGAIPKRELGAKPKIRGETLGVRKKILAINDSPVRDRSSGMDDILNIGTRGHRVVSERNRGRVRAQVSSRKTYPGIKEPRRSPGRWPPKTASKKSFDYSKRRFSEQPIDEVRSIWINPEMERSSPGSNSTIDIPTDLNEAFILSGQVKSSSPTRRDTFPTPDSVLKSPERPNTRSSVLAELATECIVCRDSLRPATTPCPKGHYICATCLSQRNNCPDGHSAVLSEPSKTNGNPTSLFPSKICQTGCRETNRMDDYAKLESRCLYRPQTCPLAYRSDIHCTWKGVRSGIRPHMKKCHGHTGTVHPFRTLFVAQPFDLRVWENRTYDVELLFVETEIFELHKVYDPHRSCLWGLLRNILARDISLRYTYNIRFQPQNIRRSVTFNSEVIGGTEELDSAFEKGKRFKFYLDSFSQDPIQLFNIHLKVIPKAGPMNSNV